MAAFGQLVDVLGGDAPKLPSQRLVATLQEYVQEYEEYGVRPSFKFFRHAAPHSTPSRGAAIPDPVLPQEGSNADNIELTDWPGYRLDRYRDGTSAMPELAAQPVA
jgi:hypothetical protein